MNQNELIAAIKALGKDDVNPPVVIGKDEVLHVDWNPEENNIFIDTKLPPAPTPVKEEPTLRETKK